MRPKTMFSLAPRLLAASLVILAAGCASTLYVSEGGGCPPPSKKTDDNSDDCKMLPGVPLQMGQLFVKLGMYTTHSAGLECVPDGFVETAMLPTGRTFYVNVYPAALGKTDFSAQNHPNGVFAGVSMNTDPNRSPWCSHGGAHRTPSVCRGAARRASHCRVPGHRGFLARNR